MTDTQYDHASAANAAAKALFAREDAVKEQASRERDEAIELADEYAQHLADGGTAWEYPEPKPRDRETRWQVMSRSTLVSYKMGLQVVYAEWNATRGQRANPYSPISEQKKYRIAEYALDRIGETIPYSTLGAVGPSLTMTGSDEVALTLAELQDTNGRDLILRRLRIEGKVAYLLRERLDDEMYIGQRTDGYERRHGVTAAAIPLEKKAKVAS